jgi:hypothetical protein
MKVAAETTEHVAAKNLAIAMNRELNRVMEQRSQRREFIAF